MLEQLMLIAASAQVQTIRLPPVAPPAPQPSVVAPPEPVAELATPMRPDLVIREIRIASDSVLEALVANVGPSDATAKFTVNADAEIKGRNWGSYPSAIIPGLAAGQSIWVPIAGWEAGISLTKANATSASVDGPYRKWRSMVGTFVNIPGMGTPAFGPDGYECRAGRGCVLELNESNNSLTVDGKPRILVAPTPEVTTALPTITLPDLPDLVITNARRPGPGKVDFEVRNQGKATAVGPIAFEAAANTHVTETYYAPTLSLASLAPGESRWVSVDCFPVEGIYGGAPTEGQPTSCLELELFNTSRIREVSATIDRVRTSYSRNREVVKINARCVDGKGCVAESNEHNNRASFDDERARLPEPE